MKIGFDAKRLFLNNTGLGNYSRTLVKNLMQFYPEHQYFLYTPRMVENDETEYFINSDKCIIREGPKWRSALWRTSSIIKDIVKDDLDIFHGLSHEIPIGLKHRNVKTCVTFHDLIFELYPELFNSVDRLSYKLKYRYACRNADAIISISQSTADDLSSLWKVDPKKINIVYQSANLAFFDTPLPDHSNRKHFLYVGSTIERKRLLDAIHAYHILWKKGVRVPFRVIGNGGSYLRKVEQEIRDLNLEKYIEFVGQVSNKGLIKFYEEAIALIYPSIYEGFGIPIIEAMLRKTPVITSNISSMPEAGGPDVYYQNPGDIKSMALNMEACIQADAGLKQRCKQALLYANSNFSPEKTAQALIETYRKILYS